MNAQTINITFDSKTKHVLVYDGILKKSILKEYYPDGATLTYKENDKFFLLDSDNDNIFIKPNVNDYNIEFRTVQQEVSSSCSQANLRTTKSNPSSMSHFQSKSVYVGWKHRCHKNTKCKHQKPLASGSKEFLLDAIREDLIRKFFEEEYSYSEIKYILKRYGYEISFRHLKRIIREFGLKRKNKNENFENIIAAIIKELNGSGSCLGYKSMWLRLKQIYKLDVYRSTVLNILQILDPEGSEIRSRYRLKRREYFVPGPNFFWHLDGYDKLKPYGFAIHGCVDGFSCKVLWLELATTNNNPKVVCHYYLQTVKKLNIVPTLIRCDKGTENTEIELVHQAFRSCHNDEYSGMNSFLQGKSTANQRIESSWGRMRNHSIDFWINFFKDMRDKDFNKNDSVQVECLRYCFAPLIKYDLELTRKEWNRHAIRKQKCSDIKSGKPNYLFYVPEANGVVDHGHYVELEFIENAMTNFSEKPTYCSNEFLKLVEELIPNVSISINVDEGIKLYNRILKKIDLWSK